MKIGIVSDIHCNVRGLREALRRLGDIDELLCLGDSIHQFRFSADVIALLKEREAPTIWGNHEAWFFSPDGVGGKGKGGFDADLFAWLAARPRELRIERGGRRIAAVHATPWPSADDYIYPRSPKLARFAEVDADIVVYGHTHHQLVERVGNVLVINPGSAGEGRDRRNDRQLSCALLDTATEEVRLFDFADPGDRD